MYLKFLFRLVEIKYGRYGGRVVIMNNGIEIEIFCD